MKTNYSKWIAGIAACFASTFAVYAAVTFYPESGTGFVGKGDVQYTFGWNNKALQDKAAAVKFRVFIQEETETTWTCSRINNAGREVVAPRLNTLTTSTQGLLSRIARENSKGKDGPVTGFFLDGYNGGAPDVSVVSEGQPIGSCPSGPADSPFTFDEGSLEETTIDLGGGIEVSPNGGSTWTGLLEAPL